MRLIAKSAPLIVCLAASLSSCGGGKNDSLPPQAAASRSISAAAAIQPVASDYEAAVQQIYVSYFGRPADAGGLVYFEQQFLAAHAPTTMAGISQVYSTNAVVKNIIDSFATSAESAALYSGNNSDFISSIYKNLFNRTADSAGLAFWVGTLDKGILTRSNAAISIMVGAAGSDIGIIANKTQVARNFTAALNTSDKAASYSGLAVNAGVRLMLGTVNELTDLSKFNDTINKQIDLETPLKMECDQLSTPTGLDAATPISMASSGVSAVVRADGSLWAWGGLLLGWNLPYTSGLSPIKLGDGFATVVVGSAGVTGLKKDGTLWSFGIIATSTGTSFGAAKLVGAGYRALVATASYLAIKADNSLWTWGVNSPSIADNVCAAAVSTNVSAGIYVLKNDKTLWQINSAGVSKLIATDVVKVRGGSAINFIKSDKSLWNFLEYLEMAVPQKVGDGFTEIASGSYGLAIDTDGKLWGNVVTSGKVSLLAQFDTSNTYGKFTMLGTGFSKISTDQLTTLATKADGSFVGWGDNAAGQLTGMPSNTVSYSTPKKISYDLIVDPRTPVIPTSPTNPTNPTNPTGTTSLDKAKVACLAAPYLGSFGDPQTDLFYQTAQFDACMHRATGVTDFDVEGRTNCKLGDSIPRQAGQRATNSNYCPYPY